MFKFVETFVAWRKKVKEEKELKKRERFASDNAVLLAFKDYIKAKREYELAKMELEEFQRRNKKD